MLITRGMIAFSVVFTLLIVMPISYMLGDTQPPYEYDASRSYVIPQHTAAGKQITVHWHFLRINRICVGRITRHIVDQMTGVNISYDPTLAAATVEVGMDSLDRTFFLPQGILPGMKWYFAEGEYACNPLQRFYPLVTRTPRLSFEVTE